MDYRGLVLIAGGIGLSVFGFQQSEVWGRGSLATWLCILGGVVLLTTFVVVESRSASPLIQVRIFAVKAFLVENIVLLVSMAAFVPLFFFASEYAQISLAESPTQTGLFLLYFFIGFIVAAQIGTRMLERFGAKLPVVLGSAIAAIGFPWWARETTTLHFDALVWCVVPTGAGMGRMLGPANGDATGITQTVRNYAASLGLAVLGTIFLAADRSRLTTSLVGMGLSQSHAAALAVGISEGSAPNRQVLPIINTVRLDFAYATRTVLYVMAGAMIAAARTALVGLKSGRHVADVEETVIERSVATTEQRNVLRTAPGQTTAGSQRDAPVNLSESIGNILADKQAR